MNKINWKIGGPAGAGIMTVGTAFAKVCSRAGLHVFAYTEYPSLIRGGHNTFHIRADEKPVHSTVKEVNILVALDKKTIDLHLDELKDGCILYDAENISLTDEEKKEITGKKINLLGVPFAKLVGQPLFANTAALGASFGMIEDEYFFTKFTELLTQVFERKGKEIVDANIDAAKKGFDHVRKIFKGKRFILKPFKNAKKRMLIDANEAIVIGALKAGCKFISAYPMTPASSVLQFAAKYSHKYNIVTKHVEDELAAMCFAIGAAHAGVRAMTATSGGGFSLMTEALGLAACTETPVVCILAQRPGPSTGMPTWTEQSDLRQALHASQGEFDRVILAPGDMEEMHYKTIDAFNIAEQLQLPVIIMDDKFLATSRTDVEPFEATAKIDRGKVISEAEVVKVEVDKNSFKKRHAFTEDNISPRWFPGAKNGMFVTGGNEHDETGDISTNIKIRNRMMQKRSGKLKNLKVADPVVYGAKLEQADIVLVGWGSTKGVIIDALEELKHSDKNLKIAFAHYIFISPWPQSFTERLKGLKAKKIVAVENNFSGQLADLISQNNQLKVEKMTKYDGRPFFLEELVEKIKGLVTK